MRPHDVEVLLHHYYSHGPWPRDITEAYKNSIQWMIVNGLYEGGITNKGVALVKMILKTPMPEIGYYNPETGERVGVSP